MADTERVGPASSSSSPRNSSMRAMSGNEGGAERISIRSGGGDGEAIHRGNAERNRRSPQSKEGELSAEGSRGGAASGPPSSSQPAQQQQQPQQPGRFTSAIASALSDFHLPKPRAQSQPAVALAGSQAAALQVHTRWEIMCLGKRGGGGSFAFAHTLTRTNTHTARQRIHKPNLNTQHTDAKAEPPVYAAHRGQAAG